MTKPTTPQPFTEQHSAAYVAGRTDLITAAQALSLIPDHQPSAQAPPELTGFAINKALPAPPHRQLYGGTFHGDPAIIHTQTPWAQTDRAEDLPQAPASLVQGLKENLVSDLDVLKQSRTPKGGGLHLPIPYVDQCGPHLLVARCDYPQTLADLEDPEEAARVAARAWLEQALLGDGFPLYPSLAGMGRAEDGRLYALSGPYAHIAQDTKDLLLELLIASADSDPDRLGSILIQLSDGPPPSQAMQTRLRQIAPFRDGAWNEESDGESLAEYLMVQWRFAAEMGYTPSSDFVSFIRGFTALAVDLQRRAPQRDLFREVLYEIRFKTGLQTFMGDRDLDQLFNRAETLMNQMVGLPEQLQQALDKPPPKTADQPSGSSKTARVIALLILLLAHHPRCPQPIMGRLLA